MKVFSVCLMVTETNGMIFMKLRRFEMAMVDALQGWLVKNLLNAVDVMRRQQMRQRSRQKIVVSSDLRFSVR